MPKIVDHDEYRQEMLDKCFDLFTRKGYSNISMKGIADEIGVSTGTLYHYFSSKESMLTGMLTLVGNKSVDEYVHLTSSIESISDRFDMIIDFWKEKSGVYKNIMLLAIDIYRNVNIKQWKEFYTFFEEHVVDTLAKRLNISRQFANSIYMYFIGISFRSLAFEGTGEYHKQIDVLATMLRPIIVDTPKDTKKAMRNSRVLKNKKNNIKPLRLTHAAN